MVALPNAHAPQGGESLPTGQQPGSTSEIANAKHDVSEESVRYAQKPDYEWFVLRATRGRELKAYETLLSKGVITYLPTRHGLRTKNGRRKWCRLPLVPQLLFLYSKRKEADTLVNCTPELNYLSYYYNHFAVGSSGYNPPLTVPYNEMLNFIRVTSVNNVHVMNVSPEQVHYKCGELVRIIDGDFAGVIGKVARVKGQQRVVVKLEGVCIVATAYIPKSFIEKI